MSRFGAPAAMPDSFLFPTFASCPGCAGPVRGEMSADLTVFVCVRCGSSWHIELGVVYEVDTGASDSGSFVDDRPARDVGRGVREEWTI